MKRNNIISEIYIILFKSFGKQGWWPIIDVAKKKSIYFENYYPDEKDVFEICTGAILTQNTSWKNVEKALYSLKVNNFLNPEKILYAENEKIYSLIRSSGYFRQKTLKIKEFSRWFIENKMKLENIKNKMINEIREALLNIKGIGKETADSILLYAFSLPIFVIDSYTKRIYARITGDWRSYEYDEIRGIFERNIVRDIVIYNEFHALLVKLAKDFCHKTNPLCNKCSLNLLCNYYRRNYER